MPPTGTPTVSRAAPASSAAASGPPAIDGIRCDTGEQLVHHVHSHLVVRAGTTIIPVPAGVGITSTCLYWLHTHEPRGIIHVEAPEPGVFTLGQFFDVWGQPLTPRRVATADLSTSDRIFAFVDGVAWTGDPHTIELRDHAVIELQVDAEPRSPFDFDFPFGS